MAEKQAKTGEKQERMAETNQKWQKTDKNERKTFKNERKTFKMWSIITQLSSAKLPISVLPSSHFCPAKLQFLFSQANLFFQGGAKVYCVKIRVHDSTSSKM